MSIEGPLQRKLTDWTVRFLGGFAVVLLGLGILIAMEII